VSSDINLLGAIDMQKHIVETGMDAKIFALVHDSVLAEVREDLVEDYSIKLRLCIQKDRGLMIQGSPVGCDFDVADDYSLGKFGKLYGI
jgi:DNA polymerase I-like protein with 3'-5' exonuclease and polymerase domains